MKKFLKVLKGETVFPPPIWMMRQAGRYLPEYRQTRERAGSFLDLCYNSELATEVTMQPIRRFGFDAAILFSDILVVPHALGRELRFEEGRGPVLTPILAHEVAALGREQFHERLAPVYETVRRVRHVLPDDIALIGFCGAPWTVATYMIAGEATADQAPARIFSYRHGEAFAALLDFLADLSAEYLIAQIDAGADAVQIFDSWAGVLDDVGISEHAIRPVKRIVDRVRQRYPDTPIIGFPKGAGIYYRDYRKLTGVTALGLDWTVGMDEASQLQKEGPIQGNLDPLRLLVGGPPLEKGVERIVRRLGNGPLVFNLGHGIVPQTPPSHVERMIDLVRKSSG